MLKISLNISVKNQEKEIENLNMGRKKKTRKIKQVKRSKRAKKKQGNVVTRKLAGQNTLVKNQEKEIKYLVYLGWN